MEWELTSSQAHSFVPIYRPQKSCAPHADVNIEKKFQIAIFHTFGNKDVFISIGTIYRYI